MQMTLGILKEEKCIMLKYICILSKLTRAVTAAVVKIYARFYFHTEKPVFLYYIFIILS